MLSVQETELVVFIAVTEREGEDAVVIYLFTGPLKCALCWSQYQDANLILTNPVEDDLGTAPSRTV